MSRTFKDRKWTLRVRDSGAFVPRPRVYGRRVSAAEVLAALGGGRVCEVVSAVGEVERDSEVARLEAAGFDVSVRLVSPHTLVGYRWVDRSGNMWDTTKGEHEGLIGFELARARGSVVGFERVFSLPVFEVVGVKGVSAAGDRGGSENEGECGASACGLGVECDAECGFDAGVCSVGGCALGESACGVDEGVSGYRPGECPASSGECPVSEACPGDCPAPGGCPAASVAGDDSLTVGGAVRLLGDAAVRAARERGSELRAAYDALSDPDFASGLDWRTLQDRETGRVRRNIRWERAGSRRRVEPAGVPVPRLSWDGVEARAAVRRVRHEAARTLASLARAVNSGVDPLDDERM
jgi:hypothetical protein